MWVLLLNFQDFQRKKQKNKFIYDFEKDVKTLMSSSLIFIPVSCLMAITVIQMFLFFGGGPHVSVFIDGRHWKALKFRAKTNLKLKFKLEKRCICWLVE